MRMLIFPFLFICLQSLSAQNFEIKGKILDQDGRPLESATVFVEKIADSSLVSYTVSENDGSFLISGKTEADKLNLIISFSGFKPYYRQIKIVEEIKMGEISMETETNDLSEVIVTANRAPITIKKDTLEFNADSFVTRPDANLEELLKKLPGVEVDTDGNVTVNGRPVSRFLVNGEEFFGDDHRIATKNLPKEIIDKIQVMDTKTKAQEFTGRPGDPDNKTVNVTIKKDKNKGYFARATAGGGTDGRYELSGIGNYFKDDLRVSGLASSNNINSSGFSYDEVYGMMGRSAARNIYGGNGGGITKAETGGINFVNKWDKDIKLSADYFFGRNDTEQSTTVARENILPDSRYFTNSDDSSNLLNDSHRANGRFEVEFDTLTRLSVRPRFNSNYGTSHRSRFSESLDENQNLINNSTSLSNEQLESEDFSNNIDFIKRFGSGGAYIQLEFSNDHSRQRNDNFYYSESMFFKEFDVVTEIQDQYIDEDEVKDEYSFEVSKRSVLAPQFFLDVSYDFDYSNSKNKRFVYEAENGDYNILNNILSNDFDVTSKQHTPKLGLNYEGDKWRVNTDLGLLHTSLENENFLEETSFDNTYNNPFVRAQVRYEIERSKSLSLRYDTNADIPSIRQLQPVVDRTNPLHIVVGNPELRPSYRQSINFDYRNFDFSTRSGFFGWINMSFTDNNVVSVTIVDEDLVRNTTYTNVNGAKSANVGTSFNKQIKDGKTEFRYSIRLNTSYNKNIGFINAVKYNAESYSISPNFGFTYAIEELIEINTNYNLSYHNTSYDINADRDEETINHRIGLGVTSYWPKNVVFGNDISYNYFGNVSPGFDNTSILWNLSLGYKFLKDDATIKVNVYDLLDQNVDTRRIIGDDYIQDTRSLILTRYAMLSFTYKLGNFGGSPHGVGRRGRSR
jgi:hypothetical protein